MPKITDPKFNLIIQGNSPILLSPPSKLRVSDFIYSVSDRDGNFELAVVFPCWSLWGERSCARSWVVVEEFFSAAALLT